MFETVDDIGKREISEGRFFLEKIRVSKWN
ncbi:MAG: hypothetical protein ACI97N_001494 [Cognaticolwellia sp.]|jgi:hypothetical protein